MRNKLKRFFSKPYRECTHGDMIKNFLSQYPPQQTSPVFVELGAGFTTAELAELARLHNATFYSCDSNSEKIKDLKIRLSNNADNIDFLIGDSLESLSAISQQHNQIHFVFFDSAPSAMHTFHEFSIIEKNLKPDSCILIDNACIPEEKAILTPCRKGKILVPYLLASPNWQVFGHPHAGDSMVSAIYKSEPIYSDPAYELSGWIDSWKYNDQGEAGTHEI